MKNHPPGTSELLGLKFSSKSYSTSKHTLLYLTVHLATPRAARSALIVAASTAGFGRRHPTWRRGVGQTQERVQRNGCFSIERARNAVSYFGHRQSYKQEIPPELLGL